jgi:hypothetical protein
MKNKKGFYFTLDALFALILLIVVISLLPYTNVSRVEEKYKTSYIQEDGIQLLSSVRTVDVNNTHIINIINNPSYNETLGYSDMLIETVSKLWATGHIDDARNVTAEFFGQVLKPEDNFAFFLSNGTSRDLIYSQSNQPFDSSTAADIVVSKQFISGVGKGQSVKGYTARALLQRKEKTKLVYFGGYVGEGNISQIVELPNMTSINEVKLEMVINIPTQLWVNNNFIAALPNSSDSLTPITYNLPSESFANFTNGTNLIEFRNSSNLSSIAGGYFEINYRTNIPGYVSVKKKYLPGISGIINLYDSIYVPNTIESMNVVLHYKINNTDNQNATIFLTIGNVTVYRNTTNYSADNFVKILSDGTLSGLLDYFSISNKTVPIRLGFEEMTGSVGGGEGNADVVLITDVSTSMTSSTDVNCNVTWNRTTSSRHAGSWSVSGPADNKILNDNGKICIFRNFTSVNANTNVSFWYRVRSQAKDNLSFYIDGISKLNISGNVNSWTSSINFSLGPIGIHEIKWCYEKNASGSLLEDKAWIDDITIRNSTGVIFTETFESALNGWSFITSMGYCTRLDIAKEVDKIFVDTVLNVSGNKVGLTSYSTSASGGVINWSSLTNNTAALKNQINTYTGIDYTCTSCGIQNATRIIATQSSQNKFKGMLVMTDGQANTCIPGINDGMCGASSGGSGYNGLAGREATNKACEARNATNNITVFAVGFGSGADIEQVKRIACWNCTACPSVGQSAPVSPNSPCWIQNVTYPNGTITTCLESRWANSSDYEELKTVYTQFGEWMVGLGYAEQAVNLTGNFSADLYNDSYIEYNYSELDDGSDDATLRRFGNLLTFESPTFTNGLTTLNFSQGTCLEAVATSYSGAKWTKFLKIDNGSGFSTVYNLSKYGSNYISLGDPFQVNIPVTTIEKNNLVELKIANSSVQELDASPSSKIIYTLLVISNYSYSNITPEAKGCNWSVEQYDGSFSNFLVPEDYSYSNQCVYNSANGPSCLDANTAIIISNDAIAQATYMLFKNYLDSQPATPDCKIDIKLDDYYIYTILLPSVPFLYYTTAESLSWR